MQDANVSCCLFDWVCVLVIAVSILCQELQVGLSDWVWFFLDIGESQIFSHPDMYFCMLGCPLILNVQGQPGQSLHSASFESVVEFPGVPRCSRNDLARVAEPTNHPSKPTIANHPSIQAPPPTSAPWETAKPPAPHRSFRRNPPPAPKYSPPRPPGCWAASSPPAPPPASHVTGVPHSRGTVRPFFPETSGKPPSRDPSFWQKNGKPGKADPVFGKNGG